MDRDILEAGDTEARGLIQAYWTEFEDGQTWNYHNWPPRYVPSDSWATVDEWIRVARRCLDQGTNILQSLEVLLAEGQADVMPLAQRTVQEWDTISGHDAYYYYDLLARFPVDDPLRIKWLHIEPAELDQDDGDSRLRRKALLSVEYAPLCRHLACEIAKAFTDDVPDEERAENYALPRMLELGSLLDRYVPRDIQTRAKNFCLHQLEKDKRACKDPPDDDERSLWVRAEIARWSWSFRWDDVLRHLVSQDWYWETVFEWPLDYEHYSLLAWSLVDLDVDIKPQALRVMRSNDFHKIDGAISWLRARRRRV